MEQLIVLGTGNAMVTRCFNTCFALDCGDDGCLLVDTGGGNGLLARLDEAAIDPLRIGHLILTHAHTDHILGGPWLVRRIGALMKSGRYEGNFVIHTHRVAAQALRQICALTLQGKFMRLFDERILFDIVEDGDERTLAGRTVRFFDIESTKAPQFGFVVTLADGRRLCCAGDEPISPAREGMAQGADWLLCEAFCRYADQERYKPYEKHHGTVRDACLLAERLGVKGLVLWHSEDDSYDRRTELYTAEGEGIFHGRLVVPRDLDKLEL